MITGDSCVHLLVSQRDKDCHTAIHKTLKDCLQRLSSPTAVSALIAQTMKMTSFYISNNKWPHVESNRICSVVEANAARGCAIASAGKSWPWKVWHLKWHRRLVYIWSPPVSPNCDHNLELKHNELVLFALISPKPYSVFIVMTMWKMWNS